MCHAETIFKRGLGSEERNHIHVHSHRCRRDVRQRAPNTLEIAGISLVFQSPSYRFRIEYRNVCNNRFRLVHIIEFGNYSYTFFSLREFVGDRFQSDSLITLTFASHQIFALIRCVADLFFGVAIRSQSSWHKSADGQSAKELSCVTHSKHQNRTRRISARWMSDVTHSLWCHSDDCEPYTAFHTILVWNNKFNFGRHFPNRVHRVKLWSDIDELVRRSPPPLAHNQHSSECQWKQFYVTIIKMLRSDATLRF